MIGTLVEGVTETTPTRHIERQRVISHLAAYLESTLYGRCSLSCSPHAGQQQYNQCNPTRGFVEGRMYADLIPTFMLFVGEFLQLLHMIFSCVSQVETVAQKTFDHVLNVIQSLVLIILQNNKGIFPIP